jgi:hypothetical protein
MPQSYERVDTATVSVDSPAIFYRVTSECASDKSEAPT